MRLAVAILIAFATAPFAHAQDVEEQDFALALLTNFNPLSIEFNREVCGYIVRRRGSATLETTKVSWGTNASCATLPVPPDTEILSSWHTHSAWGEGYDSEVPSTIDVEGDMAMGVNGWVGTPGGRLWFIDGRTGDMRQVCGRDCLPSDPNFVPDAIGSVPKTYTLDGLFARFGRRR